MDNFKIDLNREEIITLLNKQLSNFFFLTEDESGYIEETLDHVLERCYNCFKEVDNKYFNNGSEVFFNHYHSGQYAIFLYYFSNSLFRRGRNGLCDKIYYLNKIMHAVDMLYAIELPDVFFMEHPVGSVLGRAKYGNYLTVFQGCTVGGNKGKYPQIGDGFTMYSGSKILGDCKVGNNVSLAANTYVKDSDLPDGVLVFGQSPNLVIKPLKR